MHTVVTTSFIQDNGLEAADNRGKFYGYRNTQGTLEAVALIGHTTLVESRSEDSLAAFALVARESETPIHILMADGKTTETFWRYFSNMDQKPRLVCTELLFELSFPFLVQNCDWDVRLAKLEELEEIAEAHAAVAFMESGVCPMQKDLAGFLRRCRKRIKKGRTFVVFKNGKFVFKADVVAETVETAYLEGIYVAPEFRNQNIGSSCLAKLSLHLLNQYSHLCLLSNIEFKKAHRSYAKAGYQNTGQCQTIFV